jgi:phosphoribosyl 1,2-cyclic phosphodiesterase
MRVCVLGSGSRGNCTLVQSKHTNLLVDAARLGKKYIAEQLESLDVSLGDITGIVATHLHGDHVDSNTTARICNQHDIPLYVHFDSYADLLRRSSKFEALKRAGLVRLFDFAPFAVGELTVTPFPVTHGGEFGNDIVGRPVGYSIVLHNGGAPRKVGFTTDLGHVDGQITDSLAGSDCIVMECNHDVETERNSTRPYFLVRWVLGPRGHLSNDQCGDALRRIAKRSNGALKNIVLAHLSEDCNTPDLALNTVRKHLAADDLSGIPLHVALQKQKSEIIEL